MRSDTGHASKKADEARRTARKNVRLTVDVKPLRTHEVDNILFGQGFEELHSNSLALSKPQQVWLAQRPLISAVADFV